MERETSSVNCSRCYGTGYIPSETCDMGCVDCQDICPVCNGRGKLPKQEYTFTRKELSALYRILEKHYIDYHDEEAHEVVNRIMRILKESK